MHAMQNTEVFAWNAKHTHTHTEDTKRNTLSTG